MENEAASSVDVLVVGAGPTGIAVGARAREAGLSVVLVDRGPVTANLLDFPQYMTFFTTRDRLEIPDVPFACPDDKPNLRQALAYYRGVVDRYRIPVAAKETVRTVTGQPDGGFTVLSARLDGETVTRSAGSVVLATGYFGNPRRLGVPGEDADWVHSRYREPYRHHGERVVLVGGGNSVCEAALELWRNGAHPTLVVRGPEVKPSVKYWVKPDIENRIEEGSIDAHFGTVVESFSEHGVDARTGDERFRLTAGSAYVLIGYDTDAALLRRCGVEVEDDTLVPVFDEESCESNVQGLFIAGALQSGRDTNKIFIDNSREHAPRIVARILSRAGR